MKSMKWIAAAALAGAFGIAAATQLSAADSASSKPIAPYQAISLDAGTKHIAGYFHPVEGHCQLTLMIGDVFHENDVLTDTPVMRVQLSVASDKPARFDAAGGRQAEFECLSGAQAMRATVREQLASVVAP
jgi:hypothetical protein